MNLNNFIAGALPQFRLDNKHNINWSNAQSMNIRLNKTFLRQSFIYRIGSRYQSFLKLCLHVKMLFSSLKACDCYAIGQNLKLDKIMMSQRHTVSMS